MILRTILLCIEYDRGAETLIPETPTTWTLDEAIASILSGEPFGTLRSVHRIDGDKCEDISEHVADRIVDVLIRGDFVSPVARDFANFMCRDMPTEEAA